MSLPLLYIVVPPVSRCQLRLSCSLSAPVGFLSLPGTHQSFSHSPLGNSFYHLYNLALSTITHFLWAGVYITVVSSNSLQDYFTVSPQLLSVFLSFICLPVHVLLLPLLNSCLVIYFKDHSTYIRRISTSFLAFLASSLFLTASSLSARASAFLRSIVAQLLIYCQAQLNFNSNFSWGWG